MDFILNIIKAIAGFICSSIANVITSIGGQILKLEQSTVVGIALIVMISWLIYLIRDYKMEPSLKYGQMAGSVSGFLGLVASYQG